ncbi:MAG: SUMF1/EgtB/PvdO family nonheme iron enzyme [Planctomycetes bacterium]|nr:SUMF1/EgtB/PvdO family nonheme iron enzyme [Planctomycetota bacterium]
MTDVEQHRAAKDLFALLVYRGPQERERQLATSPVEPEVRELVRALLRAHDELAALGDPDPEELPIDTTRAVERRPATLPPAKLGSYHLLGTLGEGGMGVVYLAEEREPVRRRVAIKVIKPGMDSESVLRRFSAERQALSLMEHGNIARIYHAGSSEDGRPYFVMEYVRGTPLTDYCEANRLDLERRLRLFLRVCSGVQHAHQKGIIHRDLKPSNILVASESEDPEPKIIDFGLARAVGRRLTDASVTMHGHVVGTPAYMSPEQAGLDNLDVDTRTDVYSLGVILYELLVSELPFRPDDTRAGGLAELQRQIREDEPPRPSTRISTGGEVASECAKRRGITAGALREFLRRDLDWIVMTALHKDRTRRYQTVRELALDIERFLRGEPLQAGPPTVWYRVSKLVRRYRGRLAAAAVVLLALLVGLAGTALGFVRAARAEGTANLLTKMNRLFLEPGMVLGELRGEAAKLVPAGPQNAEQLADWVRRAEAVVALIPEQRAELPRIVAARPQRVDLTRFTAQVERLIGEIRAFDDAHEGLLPRIRERAAWAAVVQRRTVVDHAQRWTEARAAIARHPAFGGLDLRPQIGLIPLGPDPKSGFWEFLHLRSQERSVRDVPQRDANGRLQVGIPTGIVFVLLPGGTFTMGCQDEDPTAPNYDRDAAQLDAKAHRVSLAPFFLAKFETTQMQWMNLADPLVGFDPNHNPSRFPAGSTPQESSFANPVENVSWVRICQVLAVHGLTLPTEAQWEYACRAGTTWRWSSGAEERSLHRHANVADATYRKYPGAGAGPFSAFDDGFVVHAQTGTFLPNPFGLYDMHGNVWEWCRDRFGSYETPTEPGSGLRLVTQEGPDQRVFRGGGFDQDARHARCAQRVPASPTTQNQAIGFRAAREIQR